MHCVKRRCSSVLRHVVPGADKNCQDDEEGQSGSAVAHAVVRSCPATPSIGKSTAKIATPTRTLYRAAVGSGGLEQLDRVAGRILQ